MRAYPRRTLGATRVVLLTTLLLVATTAGACGAGAPDHVRIGVIGPLTGPRAAIGRQLVEGAAMAVEDLNAAGGLLGQDVELVTVDDADLVDLPARLADLAERWRVSAVIGPESTGPVLGRRSPLVRRGVAALLPGAFAGDLTTAPTFVARTIPSARDQARALGPWLAGRGITAVGVLLADPIEGDAARPDLVEPLEDAGLRVTVVEADGAATDLRGAVASLRSAAADAGAVLLWAPPTTAARATRAIRQSRWDVQVVVPVSAFLGEFRTLAGTASEGVVMAGPYRPEWFTSASMLAWFVRYHTRHGIGALAQLETLVIDLPVVAAAAYDAVGIVAAAVGTAGTREPADVAAALTAVTHDGMLTTYDLRDREAWSAEELYVARFHALALTFDADGRLDGAEQRRIWQAQVAADVLPDELLEGPLGPWLRQLREGRPVPEYTPPLSGPGPVGRP